MTIPERMIAALERGIAERAEHAGPLKLSVCGESRNLSADDIEALQAACLSRGWRFYSVRHLALIEYRRGWPWATIGPNCIFEMTIANEPS